MERLKMELLRMAFGPTGKTQNEKAPNGMTQNGKNQNGRTQKHFYTQLKRLRIQFGHSHLCALQKMQLNVH
jgi:hypothetical protein